MNKIKLFQVVPDLGTGGGEKVALDIAKNLNKNEFDVTIISLYNNRSNIYNEIAKENNIKIKYFNKSKGLDLKLILKIKKYFVEQKPDVVHTHLASHPYIIWACICANVKVKVHTVHNIAEKELPKSHRKIMKFAYKYLGCKPIAISDYIKKTICKLYDLDDTICVYNCIDTITFHPQNIEKNNNEIVFINIGRMTEQKNQLLLIEAFNETFNSNKNCKLKIIGDGELKDIIKQKIEELGMNKNIELLGIKKNIADYINKADIFVLSSDYEGLPLSVLEAMACGLPIITTKAGGVIDIVKEGENGLLVDIKDKNKLSKAMLELSNNKELIKSMGINSYEKSKLYTIDKMVGQYEKIYKYKS